MGQNKSRAVADICNQVAAEVITENLQGCKSNANQDMVIKTTGLVLFTDYKQTSNLNMKCVADFKMNANIAVQISNAIKQAAEAQGVAILDILKFNSSEVETYIKNSVTAKITTKVTQDVVSRVKQRMILEQTGAVIGSNFIQSSDLITQAFMDSIASTEFGADIQNKTSQDASAVSQSPLQFLSDYMLYIVLFFVIIIGGAVFLLFSDVF